MIVKFSLKILSLLCFSALIVFSQKLPIRQYTTEDGLPPYIIEGILQDHLGNMWFTTQGGLVRYNGKQFMHFTMDNGLAYDFCRPVVEDQDYNIWVGTLGGGLTKVTRNDVGEYEFKIVNTADGLTDNSVLSLAADSAKTLWVGTKSGVSRLQLNSLNDSLIWTRFLSGVTVNHIFIDRKQQVWCGDIRGYLYRYWNNRWDTIRMFGEYSSGISGMVEIRDGEYHIGSFNNGARKLIIGKNNYQIDSSSTDEVFLERRIYSMIQDVQGRILASSRGEGLIITSNGSVRKITTSNGLMEDQISCVFEDRQNNIWAGLMNGSLCKWSESGITHFDEQSGLPGGNVLSVLQDKTGLVRVITHETGLSVFNGLSWKHYSKKNGLPTNNLYTMYEDSKGRFWISTFGMGLVIQEGERFARFHPENFLLNDVLCICEDSEGNMWFGTDVDGVVRYNKQKQLDVFNMNHGLAGQRVLSIHEDSKGRLWLGCAQPSRMKEAGGICYIESHEKSSTQPFFKGLAKHSGFKSRYVSSIHESRDKGLWLGTRYHGLVRYSGDSIRYYTEKDGLPSNTITAITEDKQQRIWIGTLKGLAILERESLTVITRDHGLFDEAVNENAMICDRNGTLWIGVPKGLTALNYSPALSDDEAPPSLYIEHIRNNEHFISFLDLNSLRYDQNNLSFEVTGIDFRFKRGLEYRCFLDGFEKDWQKWADRDYFSYTNLDPGEYQLNIQTKNVANSVSNVLRCKVILQPAFWQTWWFRLIILLILIFLFPSAYKTGVALRNRWIIWYRKRHIANYKILSVIGEGSMGIVYKAKDRLSSKEVSLKVMNPKILLDEDNKIRFERESCIMSSLDHPNVIKVFSTGNWHGIPYIAMELLKGGNLKNRIRSPQDTDVRHLTGLFLSIAEGLSYIHQKGIIHRDLKSDNIMMNDHGVPKIMDFGLSKSSVMTTLTQTGTTMGTLGYVSPEQITGARTDERSDIFSFGVIMYEMVTGRLPFKGDNEIALIHSIFSDVPEPPRSFNHDCPAALESVILRCLKKDPELRYSNAGEISSEIMNILK